MTAAPNGGQPTLGVGFWVAVVVGWSIIAAATVAILRDPVGANPAALARWVVGVALLHDLVVAPTVAVVGVVLARVVPGRFRGPIASALALTAMLTVFAWPVVRGFGRRPLNPSALPLDYARNLVVVVSVVWLVALLIVGGRAVSRRRPGPGSDDGRESRG